VVVVPDGAVDRARALLGAADAPVDMVVAGGASRQESVARGLAVVAADARLVICHDAARPFASPELFDRVVAALSERPEARGAVPVVTPPDTVKRVRDGVVVETLARAELALAQTPQAFDAEAIRGAHARAERLGLEATDDAMLLELAGDTVVTVPGEPANFKITTPEDMARAERLLASQDASPGR
jgi:2-C-methyl-D-erythritol 4-phosphate cytidylyltransferase / 2-C-methyl-D-erythritol 2,4-cyclodiphosphate synthase